MSDKKFEEGQFCWNELMTGDTQKAGDFYSAMFGWECKDLDMDDMIYTVFESKDKGIGGMMQIPKGREDIPPHWLSYICVDDIEAAAHKAEKLGAKIIVPVKSAGDYGRLVVLQDPTGAAVAFWQNVKACS